MRDTKVATAGLSREVPGARFGLLDGRFGLHHRLRAAAGAEPSLGMQRLQHPGGVLAARHAEVQPLFALAEDRIRIVAGSHSRTGRSPAGPSPPSCGGLRALCLRQASCARRVAGSGRATARRHLPRSPPICTPGISALRPPAATSTAASLSRSPAKKPFRPVALLGAERRAVRNDRGERRPERSRSCA